MSGQLHAPAALISVAHLTGWMGTQNLSPLFIGVQIGSLRLTSMSFLPFLVTPTHRRLREVKLCDIW